MKSLSNNPIFYFFAFAMVILASCKSESEIPPIDCNLSDLSVKAENLAIVTCLNGGKATLIAEGGKSPYTYSLDGKTFVSKAGFTNLSAKNYTGTVKDVNGCDATINFTIDTEVGLISLDNIAVNSKAGCGSSLGEITVSSSGGSGSHSFFLDGTAKSNTMSGLSSGNHTLVIKDAVGCQISEQIHVPSGVSFSTTSEIQIESIKDIITTKCAIKSCHAAGETARPDWTVFANVQNKAAQIKSRTQSGDMPRTGSLSQLQIDLIACWVDDGALNN